MTTPLWEIATPEQIRADMRALADQLTQPPHMGPIDAAMLADKQTNGYDRRADAQAMRLQNAHQSKA